jgi:hypothetical protein
MNPVQLPVPFLTWLTAAIDVIVPGGKRESLGAAGWTTVAKGPFTGEYRRYTAAAARFQSRLISTSSG